MEGTGISDTCTWKQQREGCSLGSFPVLILATEAGGRAEQALSDPEKLPGVRRILMKLL